MRGESSRGGRKRFTLRDVKQSENKMHRINVLESNIKFERQSTPGKLERSGVSFPEKVPVDKLRHSWMRSRESSTHQLHSFADFLLSPTLVSSKVVFGGSAPKTKTSLWFSILTTSFSFCERSRSNDRNESMASTKDCRCERNCDESSAQTLLKCV